MPDAPKAAPSGKSGPGPKGGEGQLPADQLMVVEVLESTLWSRQLGVMSEEVVAALVCQIFEGIR